MQIKDSLFKLKSPFETRLQRDPCSRAHVQQPRPCRRSSWATRTLINQRTDDGHTDRPSHNRMHDARPSPAGAPPALVEGRRPQKGPRARGQAGEAATAPSAPVLPTAPAWLPPTAPLASPTTSRPVSQGLALSLTCLESPSWAHAAGGDEARGLGTAATSSDSKAGTWLRHQQGSAWSTPTIDRQPAVPAEGAEGAEGHAAPAPEGFYGNTRNVTLPPASKRQCRHCWSVWSSVGASMVTGDKAGAAGPRDPG